MFRILLIVFLAFGLAAPVAAQDRAAIGRHLDALFGGDDRPMFKWPDDITYSVLGSPTAQHREGVRRAMSAIAEATGLEASDVTDGGTPAGIVLFFADALDELLPDPWFAKLLQVPGEPLADFAQRMRRRFNAPGWIAAHEYDGDEENVALAVVNVTVDNGDPVMLAMRMALAGFIEVLPSNAIAPSIFNPRPPAGRALAPIDRALLAAIYSERIEAGAPYGDMRDKLIDLIVEKLKGI